MSKAYFVSVSIWLAVAFLAIYGIVRYYEGVQSKPQRQIDPGDAISEWLKVDRRAIYLYSASPDGKFGCTVAASQPIHLSVDSSQISPQECVADAVRQIKELVR